MATKYTPSQANIDTGSTNYNVSPNLSASRGLEKVSEALQKGMQYKTQEEEMAFTRRQVDLRNTISTFNEEYANASFAERKIMAKELEDLKTGDTGRDNKWDRELDRMGKEFSSRVNINLAQETEQRRKAAAAKAAAAARAAKVAAQNNRIANQQIAYLELQKGITETTDVAEQRILTNNYYAEYVTPYEGSDDPEAKKMYIRGLGDFNRANGVVVQNRRNEADQQITVDVMTNVQAHILAEGGIDPETMQKLSIPLTQRSDYPQNQAAIKQQYADLVLSAIQAPFNAPDYVPTREDVELYSIQLADIVEADPYVVGSQSLRVAQNFGSTLAATVDRQQVADLQAMVVNPNISEAVYEKYVAQGVEDGVISKAEADKFRLGKSATSTENNQRAAMSSFVIENNVAGLAELLANEPKFNRATAKVLVGDSIALSYEHLSNRDDVSEGQNAYNALETYASFKAENLAPTKLPMIDAILKGPRSGLEMSDQELDDFIATYDAATKFGYFKANSGNKSVTADYLHIKGMKAWGVPNVGETLFRARQQPISVTQKEVDTAVMNSINANPTWTENLNDRNIGFMLNAIGPTAKTLMQGGYRPEDSEELIERTLDDHWMRLDPRRGGSSEVWIPRTEAVEDEGSYTRVFDALNDHLKEEKFGKLDYLAPRSANDLTGDWIAVTKDGQFAIFTNKQIGDTAKTGLLPEEPEKPKE